jgi:hypothetical protein
LVFGADQAERRIILTMTTQAKPAPKDLQQAGRKLWRNATAEFTFNAVEVELLYQLCCVVDEVAAMRADLREMGYIVAGSEKQPRINPVVAALANHRKLADTLATALSLPIEGEAVGRRRSAVAKQNADARWKPKSGGRIRAVRRMQSGGAA